ncbi:MAG: 3'-5' exonuclease [Candidatus Moraniibacteriota bacterium]
MEIGAVKLNENLEVVDIFSQYVKPTINPVLSDFCKSLTSIFQADVDGAKNFKDAVSDFERWILADGKENCLALR